MCHFKGIGEIINLNKTEKDLEIKYFIANHRVSHTQMPLLDGISGLIGTASTPFFIRNLKLDLSSL